MFLLPQTKPELVRPCGDTSPGQRPLAAPAPAGRCSALRLLPSPAPQHRGFEKSYKDILLGSGNSSNLRNQQ